VQKKKLFRLFLKKIGEGVWTRFSQIGKMNDKREHGGKKTVRAPGSVSSGESPQEKKLGKWMHREDGRPRKVWESLYL